MLSCFFTHKIPDSVDCFVVDLTAHQSAQLTELNHNTANHFCRGLDELIDPANKAQRSAFGVVEMDESWFCLRRV